MITFDPKSPQHTNDYQERRNKSPQHTSNINLILFSKCANNFTDNEAAQKTIKAMEADLAKCYASTVKKSEFAGSGQLLLELKADKDGKVTKINKLHSEIAGKSVVSCAEKTLKKAKLPASAEDNTGTVNVTMYFTFRDQ